MEKKKIKFIDFIKRDFEEEFETFDPLAYRTCCLDEEIKFLERLEEYD